VVANEVKELANETTTNSADINLHVSVTQQAVTAAVAAIDAIVADISAINSQVERMSDAISGANGLSALASQLQVQVANCND
jgi:methyl-accepting chemotaxis protein